jgi:excisionase family DNA binding protein
MECYSVTKLTINESAAIVGVSDRTIRRKVQSGELSYTMSDKDKTLKLIDISELQRVFGELNGQVPDDKKEESYSVTMTNDSMAVHELRERVSDLKAQIGQLSDQLRIKDDQLQQASEHLKNSNNQIQALLASNKPTEKKNVSYVIYAVLVIAIACLVAVIYKR